MYKCLYIHITIYIYININIYIYIYTIRTHVSHILKDYFTYLTHILEGVLKNLHFSHPGVQGFLVSSPKLIYHYPSPTKNQAIAQDTNEQTETFILPSGKLT